MLNMVIMRSIHQSVFFFKATELLIFLFVDQTVHKLFVNLGEIVTIKKVIHDVFHWEILKIFDIFP